MTELSRFSFPTQMRFGADARTALGEFAEMRRVTRPLLVTDAGLPSTEAFRLVAEEMERVWPEGFARFTGVRPNPEEQDVEGAFRAYSDAQCDGVVGVGGGSALDVAKVVRARVACPDRSLSDIVFPELPEHLAPFCALPTTAGTGSEVGRSSVITMPATGRKMVFGGQPLLADMAILDPDLTVGLPPALTAATGMDALTHAIESYVCPMFHPMCDAIALEAVRIVRLFLPRAYADGRDLEARGMMQMAAAMGAVAFQKDLGAAHSLAHPLSSDFGVHHGLANAIVLPHVLEFSMGPAARRMADMAGMIGIDGRDDATRARAFLDAVLELSRSVGIPPTLETLRVQDVPAIAREALSEAYMNYPVPRYMETTDCEQLLRRLLAGT